MGNFNSSKYINDFAKENYDRTSILFKKGEKDKVKAYAKEKGYDSLNSYIQALIKADMQSPAGGGNMVQKESSEER